MQSNGDLSLSSTYVEVRDGVRIAVDLWLPTNLSTGRKLPAILVLTRYWRAYALIEPNLSQQKMFPEASHFVSNGFAFVCADARGSGASFGTRSMELGEAEIADMSELCSWVTQQPWSSGWLASYGTSYTADTAFILARHRPPALKMIVAHAMDFDMFAQCMSPGGIPNTWMRTTWGQMVEALDANDFEGARALSATTQGGKQSESDILGVMPVNSNLVEFQAAVSAHRGNIRLSSDLSDEDFAYRDVNSGSVRGINGVIGECAAIERWGGPIFYRTGWQDAGTADGALGLFTRIKNPMHVIIGPWNHGMGFIADPFNGPRPLSFSEKWESSVAAMRRCLEINQLNDYPTCRMLEYYTYGEDRWKRTHEWPLPTTATKAYYFDFRQSLNATPPEPPEAADSYRVNFSTTTGRSNRWYTQLSGSSVDYGDRATQDIALLTYDSAPLTEDLEVTGAPVVHVYLTSSNPDGALFVYLEDVSPEGRVHLITEGMLRVIHRGGNSRDDNGFGLNRSFFKCDAVPLEIGVVSRVSFAMIATSVLFRRGHRIRIALAGADHDTFAALPSPGNPPTLTVRRDAQYPSRVDLPIIPRSR
jgi:putative CocE/NonD family hydrolase